MIQLKRLFLLAALLTSAVRADVISFSGNLASDASFLPPGGAPFTQGDYAQWAAVVDTFAVNTSSSMKAVTFSYGGGTNANSVVVPEGGFEPYLSLFDGSGNFLTSTFLGTTCPDGANANSNSGACYDVSLDGGVLAPGTYEIAISAFENMSFAENLGSGSLGDGFTGLGRLAAGEDLHYAFDVVLTDVSPAPEPALGLVVGVGGVVFGVVLFRRKGEGRRQDRLPYLAI